MSTKKGGPSQSRALVLGGGAIAIVGALILAAAITARPNPGPSPSPSASPSTASTASSAAVSPTPGPPSATPSVSPSPPSPSPSVLPVVIDVRISGDDPFSTCKAGGAGRNFVSSEVEPYVAVNPKDSRNIVAVWQQDRWSNGGSRGILNAVSHDGGKTWRSTDPRFTSCSRAGPATRNGSSA